jgi:hypothetical protein
MPAAAMTETGGSGDRAAQGAPGLPRLSALKQSFSFAFSYVHHIECQAPLIFLRSFN